MTTNTKNPTDVTEAGVVELTETELDKASGGIAWEWVEGGVVGSKANPAVQAATQKVADGSVRPGVGGSANGHSN